MKKLILSAAVAAVVLAPSALASVRITVTMGDMKHDLRADDLKETSVCTFKNQVAEALDLKAKKFDLKKGGMLLKEDKTLYGAGVRPGIKLAVKPVSHSFQCD